LGNLVSCTGSRRPEVREGTVMAINVSTRRDLRTFSRPVWELSGSIAERDDVVASPAMPEDEDAANGSLLEDIIELVRGR
jgi:hypothetical protein